MRIKDYKRTSRAALKGHWGDAVLATLIYEVILAVIYGPYYYRALTFQLNPSTPEPGIALKMFEISIGAFLLMIFVYFCVIIGYNNSFSKLLRDGDSKIPENIFKIGFRNYAHNVLGYFHMTILIGLWSMLLVIPGIVKSYSYAMTPYLLVDRPELSTREAIHESRRMMNGRKWQLFCLHLSFIGWVLIAILTLGIGLLWLAPYMSGAQAAFYHNILEEENAAAKAAPAASSAPRPEPVKVREFAPSNHEDYAPKAEDYAPKAEDYAPQDEAPKTDE